MSNPLLSIIIPTHNRPHLITRAVKSALEQTVEDLEVIVVDDASTQPIDLPSNPRLRTIRLSESHGGAGARNVGLDAALGRWITFLDDDDQLLPHMAAVSLEALSQAALPTPVGVISGLEEVNSQGQVLGTRLPPPVRPRGAHFFLEELEPGKSYNTKQTLVVEREVLHQIGGWDQTFRSRVHSELFLRLNPACSLLGLPIVTYQLYTHEGDRVSRNTKLRQESFLRLVHKHKSLFKAHPQMFAKFVYEHALRSYDMGQKRAALFSLCWAMGIDPLHTFPRIASRFYQSGLKNLSTAYKA
ncbi:glycosyltransferase family 2 protein [Komarekiella sp. 'clone 1']|uniref:Glycosyltransferase family 2 protein n=1 Tax=Komarekiella delphini-convector SJRDD-AB1 TaxID=2593771 RepID=A0AA40SZ68_9NOST|nr:glycosyltransferase family 2 protein [Komarekiella delphini-convector]MBD6617963.1 glycosyltransferase family 2 protein [Komarekiella delphini-convector SJRDD-AB1]